MIELTEDTENACKAISDSLDIAVVRSERNIKKFVDEMAETFYDSLKNYLAGDMQYNIKSYIKDEVETIIKKLLEGDVKTIHDLGIDYSFRYEDIRIAIWKSCAGDIENNIIKNLLDENKGLKESLEYARSR